MIAANLSRLNVERPQDIVLAEMVGLLDKPAANMPPGSVEQKRMLDALQRWYQDYLEHGPATSPLDELERNLRAEERGRKLLIRHHGLAAARPETLQSLGDELGISRERVRQLEARAIELHGRNIGFWPVASLAWRTLCDAARPLRLSDWRQQLPDQIRGGSPWELRTVRLVDELFTPLPAAWVRLGGVDWAEGWSSDDATLALLSSLRIKLGKLGRQHLVPPDLGVDNPRHRAVALALLESNPRRWARSIDGWWYLRGDKGLRVARRTVRVLGPMPLDHLMGGLARYRVSATAQPSLELPHPEVFRIILGETGFRVDERDVVSLELPSGHGPSTADERLISVFKRHGPLMTWSMVRDALLADGISVPTATMALRKTPLVREVGRRLYALNGVEPTQADYDRILAPTRDQLNGILVSADATADGKHMIRFQIVQGRRQTRHPVPETGLPEGRWYTPTIRRRGRLWVDSEWIHGLERLESKALAMQAEEMLVQFNEADRMVTLVSVVVDGDELRLDP